MFTLEAIAAIHDKFGNADTLPQYLRALNEIGVEKFDSFICDGHSEYFGVNGFTVVSPPVHPFYAVAATSNRDAFLVHLELHKEQKTSYLEMSQGLADSGVIKWTFDTQNMNLTYFDNAGIEIHSETIPEI